jgi:hypothetical protein
MQFTKQEPNNSLPDETALQLVLSGKERPHLVGNFSISSCVIFILSSKFLSLKAEQRQSPCSSIAFSRGMQQEGGGVSECKKLKHGDNTGTHDGSPDKPKN